MFYASGTIGGRRQHCRPKQNTVSSGEDHNKDDNTGDKGCVEFGSGRGKTLSVFARASLGSFFFWTFGLLVSVG